MNLDAAVAPTRFRPCTVDDETWCLDASRIQSIERGDCVQPNPANSGPYGWLLNRSDEVEVFTLAARLGLDRAPAAPRDSSSAVIVIDAPPSPFGLLVDGVLPEVEATPESLLAVPAWVQNRQAGFFSGALLVSDRLTLVLAPERLHPASLPLTAGLDPQQARKPEPSIEGRRASRPQLLVFSIAAAQDPAVVFGLSVRQVVEICEALPAVPVPTGPSHLHGLACYRGDALPVVDLGSWLGLGESDCRAGGQILIARESRRGLPLGFPVSRQLKVVELPIGGRRIEPEPRLASRVRGIFEIADARLIVPDLAAIQDRPGD